jgi:iron complex transport system ATP-binding protein
LNGQRSTFCLSDVAERPIIAPLTLDIPMDGHVLGLIGHNGSGKSTLLKLLPRQQAPTSGSITLDGRTLDAWDDQALAHKAAYLAQHLPSAVGMTVRELVSLGRYPWHGALGRFGEMDRQKTDEAMALTGATPLADRLVDTLSGGERQRAWLTMQVAIRNACCSTNRSRPSTSPTRSRCSHCSAICLRREVSVSSSSFTTSTWRPASAITSLFSIPAA